MWLLVVSKVHGHFGHYQQSQTYVGARIRNSENNGSSDGTGREPLKVRMWRALANCSRNDQWQPEKLYFCKLFNSLFFARLWSSSNTFTDTCWSHPISVSVLVSQTSAYTVRPTIRDCNVPVCCTTFAPNRGGMARLSSWVYARVSRASTWTRSIWKRWVVSLAKRWQSWRHDTWCVHYRCKGVCQRLLLPAVTVFCHVLQHSLTKTLPCMFC